MCQVMHNHILSNQSCLGLHYVLFCALNSDIDECINEVYPCEPEANCTNSIGSFSCACLTGYSGDGMTCTGKLCVLVRHILDRSNVFNR